MGADSIARLNAMKIVVVDDEKIVLDSCERVLTSEGFEVLLATSVDDALKILETQIPAVLLIDVKMPGRDGMSLMEEIKKTLPDLPIVVMSGYPTNETISESVKKGAACFIAKPFTPDELIETIRQVLSK
jgi:DNA-binding NtrC family response regulator